jgi:ABC-type lipoprotein release transport system permease subunit
MDSLPVKFDFQIGILIILLTFIISIFSAFLPTKTIFKINIPRIIEN